MNRLFILLVCLIFSACDLNLGSSYDPTTRTMYIDYYREACNETSTALCFRTRFDTDDSFVVNTLGMSGFEDLKWGARYTVQVEAERDSDGQDPQYSLQGIDSTEVIDASSNSFLLTFNMSSQILLDNQDSSWIIAQDKIFSCSIADCTSLDEAYRDSNKIQLQFSAENDELTLLAVKCHSSEADFSSVCEGEENKVWNIAHYQSDCGSYIPSWCSIYKENTDASTDWNLLDVDISDFSAVWGNEHEIDVLVTQRAEDIAAVKFVEEKNVYIKSGDAFAFKLVLQTSGAALEKSSGDVIKYLDVELNCEQYSQCVDIDNAIDDVTDSMERILVLQAFVEINEEVPVIIIKELVCNETVADFKTKCADNDDEIYWVKKG